MGNTNPSPSHNFLDCTVEVQAEQVPFRAHKTVYHIHRKSQIRRWMMGLLIAAGLILFLPWTQNIRGKGNVTTLRPEQRPQQLNSVLGGRILKWYVREGDFVKKGDTILQLGEVKVEYFDTALLSQTRKQIDAKELSARSYEDKAGTADRQVQAMVQSQALKQEQINIKRLQVRLKLQADSIDVLAVQNELNVASRQLQAARQMLDSGVISLVDFERRKVNFQNAQAKRIGAQSKLLQSRQDLINLDVEENQNIQDYTDKISKIRGEKFAALSEAASSDADVAKLQNAYSNYDARNELYIVRAPQDGQITKTQRAGLGEVIKEGEMLAEIIPNAFQYAVEMFVKPVDLPLLHEGEKVRLIFDGFPAIVFSGWPNSSYGTFGGRLVAIERSVSSNGLFRVLVAEDPADKPWPRELRMGGGSNGIALLNTVTILYELWRNINGFPPDYYAAGNIEPGGNKAGSKNDEK